MQRSIFALTNGVSTVWIREHLKLFVMRDQLVDEFGHALIVYVVIHCSVDQQQLSLQLLCERDGGAVLVALLIVLWRTCGAGTNVCTLPERCRI